MVLCSDLPFSLSLFSFHVSSSEIQKSILSLWLAWLPFFPIRASLQGQQKHPFVQESQVKTLKITKKIESIMD